MNTITIELCAEDRARLDRLVAALENASQQTDLTKPSHEAPEPDRDIAKPEKVDAPAKTDEPVVATITETDIRVMARKLIEMGKKPQLKEVVNKYAPSITEIPADAFQDVFDQLKALADA